MGLVLIVSANQVESKKIFETLSDVEAPDYRLEFDFLRPTQLPENLTSGVDLIVYNNNTVMSMNLYQQVAGWRKRGCLSSVLVLTKVNDENIIQTVESTNNMVILEKPYVDRDLCGITQKMLQADKIKQRKFRRYNVNQTVALSSYKSGFNSQTNVCNMSLGGLCLTGSLEGLQKGDLLRVDFELDKIKTHRTVNGKVVWTTNDNNEPQAGLEFVKDADVYSHLLNDIG